MDGTVELDPAATGLLGVSKAGCRDGAGDGAGGSGWMRYPIGLAMEGGLPSRPKRGHQWM